MAYNILSIHYNHAGTYKKPVTIAKPQVLRIVSTHPTSSSVSSAKLSNMTTLKTLTSLCLAASAIQTACALDLERWCMGRGVCLTSFRWCVGTDGECEFPENVYRRYVGNNVGFAGLAWNEEYEVTWKDADKDYPVNVEWSVPTENGEESIRWDKSEYHP